MSDEEHRDRVTRLIEGPPIDRALDRSAHEVMRRYRRHRLMLHGGNHEIAEATYTDL